MLYDVTSGQALASQNADLRIEPASLTKIMTAYLAFQAIKEKRLTLDQTVVPTNVVLKVKSDESRMFIEPNKPVRVQDLLMGLIVQSGNDAALALAEAVGGSEEGFVAMMNREAQRMGLKGTHFTNTDGIPDPEHYTTAVDLATLTTRLIKDFPEYYGMYSQKEFTYNKIKQPNRNRLLYIDPTVDGVKTGHTRSAGYCLISSAQRPLTNVPNGNRRLVSIVIGTTSEQVRTQESLKILNYGFQFFDTLRLARQGPGPGHARDRQGRRRHGQDRRVQRDLRHGAQGHGQPPEAGAGAPGTAAGPDRGRPAGRHGQADGRHHQGGRVPGGGARGRARGWLLRPPVGHHPPLVQAQVIRAHTRENEHDDRFEAMVSSPAAFRRRPR